MGKTRRKEKIFDEYDNANESYEFRSETQEGRRTRTKRKKPTPQRTPDEYYKDEDYGSFEKIGRRR